MKANCLVSCGSNGCTIKITFSDTDIMYPEIFQPYNPETLQPFADVDEAVAYIKSSILSQFVDGIDYEIVDDDGNVIESGSIAPTVPEDTAEDTTTEDTTTEDTTTEDTSTDTTTEDTTTEDTSTDTTEDATDTTDNS